MDNIISLYEYAKDHCRILSEDGNSHTFTEYQLRIIKKMQEMIDAGYDLTYKNTRKGTKIVWIKNKKV